MPIGLQQEDKTFELIDANLGVPGGDPETAYTVRAISRDVLKRIVKQNTTPGMQMAGFRSVAPDVINQVGVNEDLLDYCLVGWTGILWNGEPAPCTREMKLRLDIARAEAITQHAGLGRLQAIEADRPASFRPPA